MENVCSIPLSGSGSRRNIRRTHQSSRFRPDSSHEDLDRSLLSPVHLGGSRIYSDYGERCRTNIPGTIVRNDESGSAREQAVSDEQSTWITTPIDPSSSDQEARSRRRREDIVGRVEEAEC